MQFELQRELDHEYRRSRVIYKAEARYARMCAITAIAPAETLTIRLPAASARRLHHVAEIARRPVDDVIAEVLDAGLPPALDATT